MNIPKELKIGGHIFKVDLIDRFKENLTDEAGSCCVSTCRIIINNKEEVVKSYQEEVFIHEIIEAILEMNDIEVEHNVLSTLSQGLYQVFQDNGLLK